MQILDLGTGSGILAIAAQHLGYPRVMGCDIDLDSIRVAEENVRRNPAPNSGISLFCGSVDAVRSASVDLLLCNLTADVIAEFFEDIVRAVSAEGIAILSGILKEQRIQIRNLFENAGWNVESDSARGEWVALVIRKPKA